MFRRSDLSRINELRLAVGGSVSPGKFEPDFSSIGVFDLGLEGVHFEQPEKFPFRFSGIAGHAFRIDSLAHVSRSLGGADRIPGCELDDGEGDHRDPEHGDEHEGEATKEEGEERPLENDNMDAHSHEEREESDPERMLHQIPKTASFRGEEVDRCCAQEDEEQNREQTGRPRLPF